MNAGLPTAIETVRTVVAGAEPNVELMKENPQSRLPTLRLADGTAIYDFVVICEYFDTLHVRRRSFFRRNIPIGSWRCAAMHSATAFSTRC